jgi:hypothetical protein
MPPELYITIEIKERPLWKRFILFPHMMKEHYKIFRRRLGVLESIYGAWTMAGMTIKTNG